MVCIFHYLFGQRYLFGQKIVAVNRCPTAVCNSVIISHVIIPTEQEGKLGNKHTCLEMCNLTVIKHFFRAYWYNEMFLTTDLFPLLFFFLTGEINICCCIETCTSYNRHVSNLFLTHATNCINITRL